MIHARAPKIWPVRATFFRFVLVGMVLERRGHTEAAVDLARLAGLNPSGVICEILNEDGTMARLPDLARFCTKHDLKMISVAELARYRHECDADQLWIHVEMAS